MGCGVNVATLKDKLGLSQALQRTRRTSLAFFSTHPKQMELVLLASLNCRKLSQSFGECRDQDLFPCEKVNLWLLRVEREKFFSLFPKTDWWGSQNI